MSNFPEDQPEQSHRGHLPADVSETPLHEGSPERNDVGIDHRDNQTEPAILTEPREILAEGVPPTGNPLDTPSGAPVDAPFAAPAEVERPLFQTILHVEPPPPVRIPHLGHFLLLLVLLVFGFIGAVIAVFIALHFHLYGVTSLEGTKTEIHYTLGSEGLGYLFTLLLSMLIFPLIWHKTFFAGIQWNAATAIRLRWRLVGGAVACLLLALVNALLLPGPAHAPIEDIFKERGAAWLLFAFGVTFAPFFEEMFFRGFLLPTLCTAFDWADETVHSRQDPLPRKIGSSFLSNIVMLAVAATFLGISILLAYSLLHQRWTIFFLTLACGPIIYFGFASGRQPSAQQLVRPLGENGHPQWSFSAMAIGSVVTSIPFAAMHAAQTGYSIGPFLLLLAVSIVLCAVRLSTRSLASSTLVHASYNFMLFTIMLVGTSGFRHLDKM